MNWSNDDEFRLFGNNLIDIVRSAKRREMIPIKIDFLKAISHINNSLQITIPQELIDRLNFNSLHWYKLDSNEFETIRPEILIGIPIVYTNIQDVSYNDAYGVIAIDGIVRKNPTPVFLANYLRISGCINFPNNTRRPLAIAMCYNIRYQNRLVMVNVSVKKPDLPSYIIDSRAGLIREKSSIPTIPEDVFNVACPFTYYQSNISASDMVVTFFRSDTITTVDNHEKFIRMSPLGDVLQSNRFYCKSSDKFDVITLKDEQSNNVWNLTLPSHL
ncbi:MAG: hypothetical protein WCO06_07310 [Candidatus Roizmanbacteria bacterium]